MSAFYRVSAHLREHGPEAPLPDELKPDVIELRDKFLYVKRQGLPVHLSKYMIALLKLNDFDEDEF